MKPVLLITGASTGIGAACARLAATKGYDLALTYHSDSKGMDTVAHDARTAGADTLIVQADVADPDAIAQLYAKVDTHFVRLNAVINNAGIVGQTAKVTEMSHDRLRHIFDVNVIGAMLVAKEAVIRMQAQGHGGAIVNISSAAARLGSANQYVDYAASKAAIDTFTKGLAEEVAPENIRVMSLRPGLIDTGIHTKGGDPDRAERLAPMVPMQRAGTPEEVAAPILWLLSDDARYVTGSALDVSGGR